MNAANTNPTLAKILVKLYTFNGSLHSEHVCDTPEQAFTLLSESGRDGLAHPVGTTCGCYEWRARQDGHTLEDFTAKLTLCCNDPGEYGQRLIDAGICQRPLLYSRF